MSASRAGAEGAAALLVECMLGVAGDRPRLRALAAGPVEWERLAALARAHAVLETVHQALAAHGALDRVPAPLRAALRDAHEGAAARNALLLADAGAVQGALAAAGVASAFVKGAALAAAHYPALGARHMGDVDLLVASEQIGEAAAVAATLGARAVGAPVPLGRPERHVPPLVLPSGTLVELHRRYGDDPASAAATADLLARSGEVQFSGRPLRIAAPDDLLAVACHHVLRDHRDDRRFRPRHLADCAVLLGAGASADRAAALPGAAEPVAESLALLAAAVAGRLAPEDLLEGGLGPVRRRATFLARPLRRNGAAQGLRQLFFPPPAFMAWRYGVPPRSPLLPLTYLWRPLRGAWRLVTGR